MNVKMIGAALLCLTPLFCLAHSAAAVADDDSGAKTPAAEQQIEFLELHLKIVDGASQPIENASIKPYAMRAQLERGSHYSWLPTIHGPQPNVKTDADGTATVNVPKFVREKLQIGQVSWIVDHPDFVTTVVHRDLGEEVVEIKMEDGYRIAATAVDGETGTSVKQDLYAVMSGNNWTANGEWTLAKSGFIVSRVLGQSRSTVRLVHLPDGEPARFSRLLSVVRPEASDRALLPQTALEPGTRVEGKLDAAVTRPVMNGKVVAFVSAGEDVERGDSDQLWSWYDKVKIEPDGSFVFDSLPRGDVVQLIALCDGWVSKNPTEKQLREVLSWKPQILADSRTIPQVFALDGNRITPTIVMDPAATCRIEVRTPDDNPLPGAEVGMWPNHIWLRGGSTVLGTGFRTAEWLRRARLGEPNPPFDREHTFSATTDEDGIAVISNLPGKLHVGLGVRHDKFELPALNGRRSTDVDLKPGKTATITIRMQPKGTQVLGR